MANVSSNWQESLNNVLVNRLTRPLRQPGMMKMAMSQHIINRCDRFLNRLPLLSQQMQRWGNNITFSSDDVPIVYAQPISLAQERTKESRDQNFQPTVVQNKPSIPLIQRKIDSSQALPVQIQNAESSPPKPSILGEKRFQSPSELTSDPAELQAKFSDSQTTSVNPSQIDSNPRSQLDEGTLINQTAAEEEMPLVSPQAISERLAKSEEMSLVQEFTNTALHTAQQLLPIIQAKQQNSSRSRSSVPIVNPSNTLVIPKQTQSDNYDSEKSRSINYKNSKITIPSKKFPIVTVQPLTSQINQSNSNQNIAPLPIVPVTSQVNSSSQNRSSPLPLANNSSVSNNIKQKPNQANQNSRVSNTTTSSSPRIFASPSPPTQTFVSAMETQPKIDLDAITSQVEKKIMRRLVVESERRGKIR